MKKYTNILVKCGYARVCESHCTNDKAWSDEWESNHIVSSEFGIIEEVNPFADTLDGRRQADAIEDWLRMNEAEMFYKAPTARDRGMQNMPKRTWRLDRIKWCVEQLEKDK
jgi:hypothetical protein